MERASKAILTSKTLWIGPYGVKLERSAHITALSSEALEINVDKEKEEIPCAHIRLSSSDGFLYEGKAAIGGEMHDLALRQFNCGKDILFYGNWYMAGRTGELCIHATAAGNVDLSRAAPDSGPLPVAA